jgi:acyl-phosphate glycerol 3-phosphate acyltransferase
MPHALHALLLAGAYLIGGIPFGYLIGRLRGVDLFREGSGNIGATNAGRVLGRKVGILVFVLDFLKGALPVALIVPLAGEVEFPELLRVGAAALAFLGHLFPIYLGFRGGKGVATGAGTIVVLVPLPAALAMATWIVVLLVSRIVSLASLAAVTMLVAAWLLAAPAPLNSAALPITLYLVLGTLTVVLKHRANIRRLLAGAENRIGEFPMRETLIRALHLLALGFWFGGAAFFNFVSAPQIFKSFEAIVQSGPSDRTAKYDITHGMNAEERDKLGKALAGSAVGPIFPFYYAMQIICCAVSLATALAWWKRSEPIHRRRVLLLTIGLMLVTAAWPLGTYVSDLRVQRFDSNPATAEAAVAAFGQWHLVSLLLSMVTTLLAGVALALAARLPNREPV